MPIDLSPYSTIANIADQTSINERTRQGLANQASKADLFFKGEAVKNELAIQNAIKTHLVQNEDGTVTQDRQATYAHLLQENPRAAIEYSASENKRENEEAKAVLANKAQAITNEGQKALIAGQLAQGATSSNWQNAKKQLDALGIEAPSQYDPEFIRDIKNQAITRLEALKTQQENIKLQEEERKNKQNAAVQLVTKGQLTQGEAANIAEKFSKEYYSASESFRVVQGAYDASFGIDKNKITKKTGISDVTLTTVHQRATNPNKSVTEESIRNLSDTVGFVGKTTRGFFKLAKGHRLHEDQRNEMFEDMRQIFADRTLAKQIAYI